MSTTQKDARHSDTTRTPQHRGRHKTMGPVHRPCGVHGSLWRLVVVVLGAGVAAYLPFIQAPSVRPADAPSTVFSAERAMTELKSVPTRIRPMGSPEHQQSIAAIRAPL